MEEKVRELNKKIEEEYERVKFQKMIVDGLRTTVKKARGKVEKSENVNRFMADIVQKLQGCVYGAAQLRDVVRKVPVEV